MKSNIALVGFMGTGKSAAGRNIAEKLGWKFIEVDMLIEQIAGKSIPDIFSRDGEIVFREWEIEAVKQISRGKKQVISCGGGVVLNNINITRLKETGVVVLLTAAPEIILQRIMTGPEIRPLLKDAADPSGRIKEMLKTRKPYYQQAADIVVNTSKLNLNAVADLIIRRLRKYEGFSLR